MKKRLTLWLIAVMVLLAACGGNPAAVEEPAAQAPVAEAPAEPTAASPAVSPAEEPAETVPVEHNFDLSEGEERYLEGQVFSEDVTIHGDNAAITFEGCEFPGDVILTSAVGTRVFLVNCTVAGNCVFDNGVKEGTMETALPKILTTGSVDVICKDCYGSAIALGDFEITYNGETYRIEDSELFYDNGNPEAGFVPYEGQEANLFYVGQWWENGEPVQFLYCEYDPNM